MNRYLIFGIALLIAVGAWFACPSTSVQAPDALLLVDAPPAQVIGQIHALPLTDAFRRAPVAGGFEAFAQKLTAKHEESGPRREVVSLWRGDAKVLVLRIELSGDGSQTGVAVAAELPSSPLTRQRALRPGDLKALAALADVTVTDYLAASLNAQPPASSQALQDAVDVEAGFDTADHAAFARRVTQAVDLAFAAPVAAPPTEPAEGDVVEGQEDAQSADDSAADLAPVPEPDAARGEEPRPEEPAPDASGD